jgi:hypothetical protein
MRPGASAIAPPAALAGAPDRADRAVAAGGAPPATLPWWWSASLVTLALSIAAFRLAHTEADPDLWGHVRFGLDLLDTGRVARADVYSYLTDGVRWINHEWLSELMMGLAFRAGGATGLIALKTMLGLIVAILLARHLLRQQLTLLGAVFVTAYGMVVLYPGLRPLRPQAWTYVAITLVLLLIDRATRANTEPHHRPAPGVPNAVAFDTATAPSRALWWAAPIMALWANAHGGFVAGLGLLGAWWGSRAIVAWGDGSLARDAHARRALLLDGLAVAAACLATLANPYGWDLWIFLARTLTPRPEISEWQALPIASFEGATYLLVAALGVVGLLAQTPRRRALVGPLLLCGLLLPLTARRHLPLLALIVLVLFAGDAAHALGAALQRRWPRMQRASSNRLRPLVCGALLLESTIVLALARPEWTRIAVDPEAYPVAAVTRLAQAREPANLAVFFDWGEYVLWHVGPRIKVSVDGRRETVYPDDVYAENMALTEGTGEWDQLLRRPETDLALVSTQTAAASLLALHPDWELILRDGQSVLYGRRDRPVTAALRDPAAAPTSGDSHAAALARPSTPPPATFP